MPTSSISSSHNNARESGSEELVRERPLPGLPSGRGLDEPDEVISDEVLDALLGGAQTAHEIAGPDGVLEQLTRRLLNRALEAELTAHLGYEDGHARRRAGRGTRATVGRRRRCSPTRGRSRFARRGIATARSSRRSSANARRGGSGSMRR